MWYREEWTAWKTAAQGEKDEQLLQIDQLKKEKAHSKLLISQFPLLNLVTVFLLRIQHKNNIALASPNFYRLINIQHSVYVCILFPLIEYMHDDLCQKIRDCIQSFGKGCRIIRRAEFLEEIRYFQIRIYKVVISKSLLETLF